MREIIKFSQKVKFKTEKINKKLIKNSKSYSLSNIFYYS